MPNWRNTNYIYHYCFMQKNWETKLQCFCLVHPSVRSSVCLSICHNSLYMQVAHNFLWKSYCPSSPRILHEKAHLHFTWEFLKTLCACLLLLFKICILLQQFDLTIFEGVTALFYCLKSWKNVCVVEEDTGICFCVKNNLLIFYWQPIII